MGAVKHHYVVKLYRPAALSGIPDWLSFIEDKSVIRETIEPGVDRLLDGLGLRFWATPDYRKADDDWSPDEVREGLDRTYRLILQRDYDLPADLLARLQDIAGVQDARELTVAEAELPMAHTVSGEPPQRQRPVSSSTRATRVR